eukprot:SAG25_NODE_5059_length_708_cov_1.338259_1_plen_59_part_00
MMAMAMVMGVVVAQRGGLGAQVCQRCQQRLQLQPLVEQRLYLHRRGGLYNTHRMMLCM